MSHFRNDHEHNPKYGPLPDRIAPTLDLSSVRLPSSVEPSGGGAAGAETIGGSRLRTELNKLLDGFAPSELAVILFIAKRLDHGRKEHGILNPLDGHDWLTELAEEAADGMVYLAAAKLYAATLANV